MSKNIEIFELNQIFLFLELYIKTFQYFLYSLNNHFQILCSILVLMINQIKESYILSLLEEEPSI